MVLVIFQKRLKCWRKKQHIFSKLIPTINEANSRFEQSFQVIKVYMDENIIDKFNVCLQMSKIIFYILSICYMLLFIILFFIFYFLLYIYIYIYIIYHYTIY